MNTEFLYKDLSDKIIKAYYKVYNRLGYGFLEKVYENALAIELKSQNLQILTQKQIKVFYEANEVGFYIADIIVESKIILEIKASEYIVEEHEYQLLNYLKATEIEVGLLLNFGKTPAIKRKIFENKFKIRKIREY